MLLPSRPTDYWLTVACPSLSLPLPLLVNSYPSLPFVLPLCAYFEILYIGGCSSTPLFSPTSPAPSTWTSAVRVRAPYLSRPLLPYLCPPLHFLRHIPSPEMGLSGLCTSRHLPGFSLLSTVLSVSRPIINSLSLF
ncbi:hypothetical protein BO71DRAFT_139611 [Aspergillus ellipticus CBS 707.79]|uniref:Uncharacterized protein n=1 Tax=Aspergillus ellipticus CBS 707.79 TaxID=1448320 RepID=A0A319E9F1_9EURO|nr:hypothetical protein BO71DRAFT_139611 [Aspergillus ellipticus CBS 707.79]